MRIYLAGHGMIRSCTGRKWIRERELGYLISYFWIIDDVGISKIFFD